MGICRSTLLYNRTIYCNCNKHGISDCDDILVRNVVLESSIVSKNQKLSSEAQKRKMSEK